MFKPVVEDLKKIPEIVECHYATGKYSMFIKIYAKDNRHLLQIILEKLTLIPGVAHTETFQISLDEIFRRQLFVFDMENEEEDLEEEM
jgi:Lrp/AsnC family transcriptional regulator for asnA, asnC and gidA